MNSIKIYLADDHMILLEGLRLILRNNPHFEIVGAAGDGKQALEEIESLKPDVAILDISMPTMDGIEVSRQLRKYNPRIKIIILTKHDTEAVIDELLKYGVQGYILKEDAGDDLIRAIETVMKNNVYLSQRILNRVVSTHHMGHVIQKDPGEADRQFTILSPRERQVLKLVVEGKSNRDIATLLRISPLTVKGHRLNMMKKLDIHRMIDLVKYAVKCGMVEI